MKYYKMSADLENSDGMNYYELSLTSKVNDETKFSQAFKYFKMSADLGNPIGKILYSLSFSICRNEIKHLL
jgi:TPR repeat protein